MTADDERAQASPAPASAASAAARVLNPVSAPSTDQEQPPTDDDHTRRLEELDATVRALEQEVHALTLRVRKLERAQPR